MISGIKENLEFLYSSVSENNSLKQTEVVMIYEDLTNIDVLQRYFDKARILLCVFHVLKYLKNQIHAIRIPLTNRMNIMKDIRRLLYDNDQMSAIYLKEIKINSEGTDFYEYFEKKGFRVAKCSKQNSVKIYSTLIPIPIIILKDLTEHLKIVYLLRSTYLNVLNN